MNKAMNKKIILLSVFLPCFIQTGWEDWFPSNIGLNAAKEMRKAALEVVGAGAVALAAVLYAPTAYSTVKDTISPPPEVRVQQAENDFRTCLQSHTKDSKLTLHNYPIACRHQLIAFVLAKDAVGESDKIPNIQDLISEFHYSSL